jgi:hypothetical protein
MKKQIRVISSIILLTGFAMQAQAAIKCIGQKSEVTVVENQFELSQDARVKAFDLDQSAVYLTHKKDFYSLEMFIPGLEQRIYSEGSLTDKQPLTLVLWTRDQLLEVRCTQLAR